MEHYADSKALHISLTQADVRRLLEEEISDEEMVLFMEFWENNDDEVVKCGALIAIEDGLGAAYTEFRRRFASQIEEMAAAPDPEDIELAGEVAAELIHRDMSSSTKAQPSVKAVLDRNTDIIAKAMKRVKMRAIASASKKEP
jgi:hypothetical protein